MNQKECICLNCESHTKSMSEEDYDCACEGGPCYCEDMCGACEFNLKCDVFLKPENYPTCKEN